MASKDVDQDEVSFSSEVTIEADYDSQQVPSSPDPNERGQGGRNLRLHLMPTGGVQEDPPTTTTIMSVEDDYGFLPIHPESPPDTTLHPSHTDTTDNVDIKKNEDNKGHLKNKCKKVLGIILGLLPSLFVAIALEFFDLLRGVHLYFIGLMLFQALFWPSAGYLCFANFILNRNLLAPVSNFSSGRWVNLFMLQVHGLLLVAAILLSLLSIDCLDITVALALMFLPCFVIFLIEHILSAKSCSLELIATLIMAYIGVILITIPALYTKYPVVERRLYNGVAASIGSSILVVQGAFMLTYLRKRHIDDALILTSAGLQGTIVCVGLGCGLHVMGPVSKENAGYITAIFLLITLAIFLLTTKISQRGGNLGSHRVARSSCDRDNTEEGDGSKSPPTFFVSVNRQRVLIFIFACLWGLFRQFYRHVFPSAFSLLGVTVIVISFLFALGYREWHAVTREPHHLGGGNDDVQRRGNGEWSRDTMVIIRRRPFQFLPWLFSREPITFIR